MTIILIRRVCANEQQIDRYEQSASSTTTGHYVYEGSADRLLHLHQLPAYDDGSKSVENT
jgi:hypothetical protein